MGESPLIVLSGGTGTPKLLRGLVEHLDPDEITVVVNTADDTWISGNLVCPDIDSVLYTLAGIIDEERWWGIRDDTFATHDMISCLGGREMLAIGDRDRAFHIFRSDLIRGGATLSGAVARMAAALGVRSVVLPMSDDAVETIVATQEEELAFQEYWVGRGGCPAPISIRFKGIERALPSHGFLEVLAREETVLIGPSNPVTSIGPILALRGVREALMKKRVVAISPFAGDRPYSGPAVGFMRACGVPATDDGVAALFGKVDIFIVSEESSYPGPCVRMNTAMRSREDSVRLAGAVLEMIRCS